jgi:hypothetical protein
MRQHIIHLSGRLPLKKQREHIIHLLANEESRVGKLSGNEPVFCLVSVEGRVFIETRLCTHPYPPAMPPTLLPSRRNVDAPEKDNLCPPSRSCESTGEAIFDALPLPPSRHRSAKLHRTPTPTLLYSMLRRPSAGAHVHLLDREPSLHHRSSEIAPSPRLSPAVHLVCLIDGRLVARARYARPRVRVSLQCHPGQLEDAIYHLITV